MSAPTNHHVTVTNRFGNPITAPVVYIKALGDGRAECHIETNLGLFAYYRVVITDKSVALNFNNHIRLPERRRRRPKSR